MNRLLAIACVLITLVSVLGCWATSTRAIDAGSTSLGLLVIVIVLAPIVLYLKQKHLAYLCDSILTIFYATFFATALGYPVYAAIKFGVRFPLADPLFMTFDRSMGVRVPSIRAWASARRLGRIISATYPWLLPYMWLAILLPILTGKLRATQKFLVANLVALGVGVPILVFLPGVGPWFGYRMSATPFQSACQAMVFAIRRTGVTVFVYPQGVWCFPSFHVIWAVLSAWSLSHIHLMRIPAWLFSGALVCSTLTLGNHYFCDVLAGLILSCLAIFVAERIGRRVFAPKQSAESISIPPSPHPAAPGAAVSL